MSVSSLASVADSKGLSGGAQASVADSKAASVSTRIVTPTGGTVTQATNKATGVTLNARSGAITMNGAALAAAAEVTFTVTNNTVGANDVPVAVHKSAGTAGAYSVVCNTVAAGSFRITVGNWSAGSLSEAIVVQFSVVPGTIA